MKNKRIILFRGDCLKKMKRIPDGYVDSIITDPPYALEFMGKGWDKVLPSVDIWKEALRVAKPGAILMAFGGTRTYHRLTCSIEDAGWEIRDCMMWMYGSGFPKSLNISKAIEAKQKTGGSSPRNLRKNRMGEEYKPTGQEDYRKGRMFSSEIENDNTKEEVNNQWEGWGTALKPAYEPIVIAMKPLDGTFVNNALTHGVAGLNIDGGRVGTVGGVKKVDIVADSASHDGKGFGCNGELQKLNKGRFPANVVLDEQAGALLDEQSGVSQSNSTDCVDIVNSKISSFGSNSKRKVTRRSDKGGASRFFYCAKTSKSERNANLPEGVVNNHPTVKPLKLMEYLCTITKTPTGGVVLDLFMGSGTTGVACKNTGRKFIGIEKDSDSFLLAKQRIHGLIINVGWYDPKKLWKKLCDLRNL